MTDAKTIEEMREVLKRVEHRSKIDKVGVYEAAKREGISKTKYYSYKLRVETHDRMMQPQEQREIPEYPRGRPEEIRIPEKRKHKPGVKRVNIDIPMEIYDYIEKEHQTSTLSIKGMCQKIVIDYVSDKKAKGEKLFRL